jgi:hypothetical protein
MFCNKKEDASFAPNMPYKPVAEMLLDLPAYDNANTSK